MRIGIGGGLFGVRGGISNRGFGVGVGPLSAGMGWPRLRRRRGVGGNWLGTLVILAGIGWLIGQCSPDHPTQPTQIAPPLAPVTTTPTMKQTIPWGPGHEEPLPPPRTTLPYSPNGCPADGHPWCSDPTATENPEGTLPYGPPRDDDPCLNKYDCPGYTPTTTPTCSPWVPNSTDLPPCDTLPTTLPPAVPPTLLPQQTVPGVPMVPPGGTMPTTSPPCVPTETVSCGPGFGPGAPAWTTPTPRTFTAPTDECPPGHPTGPGWEEC